VSGCPVPASVFATIYLPLPCGEQPPCRITSAGALDKQPKDPLFELHGRLYVSGANDMGLSSMDRAEIDSTIRSIIEPFNKKGIVINEASTFAGDLEFDSLTVMDFVAEIEDAFDIIISMNEQAEIENYGQLVDAVNRLQNK
jgi:acyl carrier protein